MKKKIFSLLFVGLLCSLFAQHARDDLDLVKLTNWYANADNFGSTAEITQNDVVKGDFNQEPQPNDSTWPWVNMEVDITPDATNLEGMTSIKVTYKCDKDMLVVLPMPDLAIEGTTHRAAVPSASDWATEEIVIDSFSQPDWVTDLTPLDLSKVKFVEFIPLIPAVEGGTAIIELKEAIASGITTSISNNMFKSISNGPSIGRITAERIHISVPVNGLYTLSLYSMNGRVYKAFNNKFFSKGLNEISWNGKDISTGIYFVQLRSRGNRVVKRILLK